MTRKVIGQNLNPKKTPVASFTKEVNPQLPKCPLKTNGHLANLELTSFVKEATDNLPLMECLF